MTNNDELNQRLSNADPAKARLAPTLPEGILTKAVASGGRLSLKARFDLLSQNLKRLSLGLAVSGSAATVAVALVISSSSQPLIQLSGMQGSRNSESAAAQFDVGSDKMMMPYFSFEFLAGPNLPTDTGSGQVYKLSRSSTPEQVLTNVAELFDVEGSIKKYPDFSEGNPGYFFGQSDDPWGYDGKNPVISLWWLGTASWNYSNPVAFPVSACEETDSDGNCVSYQEFLPTPELLPTRAEAVAKALEVFNATGLEVSAEDIRIDISEWGVNASASMTIDSQQTNVEWYLGWSSNGEISYAGGHSVVAEPMGTFDTISAVSAVDRLADWRWSGSPSSSYYQRFQPQMSTEPAPYIKSEEPLERESSDPGAGESEQPSTGAESESPTEPGSPAEPGSPTDPAPDSPGTVDPLPEPMPEPMPMPEPEILTLTILEAERALLSIWDANGDVWLVPGWILVNDQGWFGAVIALIEGVIELPKETEVGIMPVPGDDSTVSNK